MDEIKEIIVNLKMESKILRSLVDTILDSCGLDYCEKGLSIRSDSEILTIIKTFYPEEYDNALTDLKAEAKAKETEEELV